LLLLVDLWLLWAGVPPVLVALLAATGGLLLVFWALPTDGVGLLRGRPLYRALIAAPIAGPRHLASEDAVPVDAPGLLELPLLAATGGLLLVFWALPTDGVGLLRGRPLYRAMIAAQIAGLGNLASVDAELLDAPGWLVLTLLGVSATAMWVCGLYALRWQREN